MKLDLIDFDRDSKDTAVSRAAGKAVFHAETRSGQDRRRGYDRRQSIRFTADRRSHSDRRAGNSWDDQHSN